MKKILFICFMTLTCHHASAQTSMTDEQVKDYAITLNKQGLSKEQIYMELLKKGVTEDQLKRLYSKYENQKESGSSSDHKNMSKGTTSRMRSVNGEQREEFDTSMDEVNTHRKIFGHDVFNNKNLTFQSSMNLATPQNYVLGPGDEVNVDIWGNTQESITLPISPDGTITINDIGIIQLGGLTVSQAKAKLKRVIGPRFLDSKIELTLGQTRTITINVMGEVKVPGTYTVSAFSTVFNALYMAGGPNDIGTYRVMSSRQFLLINVNRIAKCLECIEADADGQYDFHRYPVQMPAKRSKHSIKVSYKKVIVLEYPKDTEVQHNVRCTYQLLFSSLSLVVFQKHATTITAERCQG